MTRGREGGERILWEHSSSREAVTDNRRVTMNGRQVRAHRL